MKRVFVTDSIRLVLLPILLVFSCETWGQQVSDPDFDTRVARPAYTKQRPRVLFDEAHANFHTAGGR